MNVDLRSLIGKLDDTCRRSLEGAAGLCLSRTHYEVEMEHWLVKLLEPADADLPRVLRRFEVDADRFLASLNSALDLFKTGNARRPDLSRSIEQLARDAWILSSVNYGLGKVRSGVLLLAALSDDLLRRRLVDAHTAIREINAQVLGKELLELVAGSSEDREVLARATGGARSLAAPGTPSAGAGTPGLDQYTVDLTGQARAGKLDPVLGRDFEIRQIVDILTRKRQNNPILTGEAGVGKTAVVEGFAQRIVEGDVPDPLRNVILRTLDLALLQAGAGVKGEFENRLKQVIEEVRASTQPIILFIDEAHALIGAGGAAGQSDAANLLKPALARGELRTIAATTWAEYKKYFEKDAALSRRFQVVKVEEPSPEAAIGMMRGMSGMLEKHHRVWIADEALVDSVYLSARYIPARQLPDKSVSVLDTACARVSIARQSVPAAIEDHRRRIVSLETEARLLGREEALGTDHAERQEDLRSELEGVRAGLGTLEERWEKERALVGEINELRERIQALTQANLEPKSQEAAEPELAHAPTPDLDTLRAELQSRRKSLRELQGETPLVSPEVDGQAVAEVISGWTGIPMRKMVSDEIRTVLSLADVMGHRVLGQNHALEAVARRIHTSRANLDHPGRPIGVFLFVGPSGTGKTETALALADNLYGGERNVIAINMSEFQEAHTVSTLKGSPPGYVGYGEGGVLTEAVRRRPYSVVLLDEVEKAHPDVLELFFQVFDKGVLEDAEGREIDFKNTIILLTSNIGSDTIMKLCADPDTLPGPDTLAETLRPELLSQFPAALLGRLIVVPYYPIAPEILRDIIRLQLDRIADRVRANHRADFRYADELVEAIAGRCTEPESGARAVDHILTHSLLPSMSAEVLSLMAKGEAFTCIETAVDESRAIRFKVS